MGRVTIGRIGMRGYQSEVASTAADKARLQDVLESQQAPGIAGTEQSLLEGMGNGNQFRLNPRQGDAYLAATRRVMPDFNPKGKVYQPGLADFPGDPTAWIDSTSDVKRVAREKGMVVRGAVNADHLDRTPDEKPTEISDDLFMPEVQQEMALDPGRKFEDVYHEKKALYSGDGMYDKVS